mmetsp:Transcript_68878/g.162091  ORF Transcript_68878/g.162091 Transcript_68878/m.162091 type:complete len:111 (-) Transcript_68878:773-1105(-)
MGLISVTDVLELLDQGHRLLCVQLVVEVVAPYVVDMLGKKRLVQKAGVAQLFHTNLQDVSGVVRVCVNRSLPVPEMEFAHGLWSPTRRDQGSSLERRRERTRHEGTSAKN